MRTWSLAAAAALAISLTGCTTLAPAGRPAAPTPPPAAARPAPVAPGSTAPGVVPPELARPGLAVQSAPAQIVPVPPGPGVPPAASSVGLTVVGVGEVQAAPDIAYVSAGVQSRGATAREAQDANTAAMNGVLSRVKGLGVADADIRTSGVNLHPVYDHNPNQLSGYMAINQVTITVREVRRAGEILDAAITAGANQSAGVRFAIRDDSQLRRQALAAAVTSARSTADAIAAPAGLRVTGIVSMSDESGGGGVHPLESRAAAMAAPQADVPLQPGQLTVGARVRVVYQFQ